MLGLLIETSTERGMAAILEDEKIIFHAILPFGYQNSRYLLPEIERGLKSLDIGIKDFHYIAAGQGPGSYTGIRVGATVAKSLSFAYKIPLIGISTLKTFIPDLSLEDVRFAVLVDAKIGGVYCLLGERYGKKIIYLTTPEVISDSEVAVKLKDSQVVVTPFKAPLQAKFSLDIQWEEWGPDPLQMGKLASIKYNNNEYSMSGELQLNYLRKTQAEIERENK